MKKSRRILIVSLGIGLLGLIIPAVIFFTEFSGQGGSNSPEDWLPMVIIPFVLIIVAVSIIPFLRIFFPPRIKNGVTAEAEVVEIGDTGVTINDNPQVRLLLEVRPERAGVFMAEVKTVVSRLQVGQIVPGTHVKVLYDPADLKRIRVQSIDLASSPTSGVEARLDELNRLREKGLVTAEEYQRKREEIIKSI